MRVTWIDVYSDMIPHFKRDSDKDLQVVVNGIIQTYEEEGGRTEEVTIDPHLVTIAGFFSSRNIEGIGFNYPYHANSWKYMSGDISGSLGEAITSVLMDVKFGIGITDVVRMRVSKFMGILTDMVIEVNKYPKLIDFLGKEGLVFMNTRSSVFYKKDYLKRGLEKDLISSEILRYPDNFSLLFYVFLNEDKVLGVVVRP
ncbi:MULTISPECIES: hypothetical protein [Acidianus]|uniref:Uncharacterized protein n=1 Tax=Candidatus Acidianus copahuensis TaxID=1160895 RepID=A0A031LHX7_9CREN|nr:MULTISPECIES: hypothetical protein [Acidianus]EZQ01757.1 hypothetical protein CM19_12380 [Candidatus Acidianus copahuensis]NON61337.1 hypothetical protein [Acidianus sp. RZ1]